MKEITRNDFNLFQDEMLGLIKKFDSKSTEKIAQLISNVQKTELMSDQKFQNFKYEIEEIIKNLETNDTILKINERINELNTKIEEIRTVNETKISNFERDLSNACFKYDKIFLNNISSPGLIGDGCPYPTMKAFLEFANNKIKEFMNSKDKFGIDFQKYHDWVKSSLDKFKEEMDKYKEENDKYIKKEVKQYDKRSTDKMNAVEDKLSFIRVENGRYNFKLNKKWEELQEKLQMFYVMNDNLIKIYNKARNEFVKTQKDLNNIIEYLNYTKNSSPNGNKITYDKFNKRIELNKPQLTFNDNVLPPINSFEEITKNMFNTQKNNIGNNISKTNSNQKNGGKFMRLFKKKNTVNLGQIGFSFNKLNKVNQNFSNNVYTNINLNENEELQNNINNDFSEGKTLQKKNTFKKRNLLLDDKNDLSLLNKKEAKSENTKKELKDIQEDENDNKEKKDEQTSPIVFKDKSNKKFNDLKISHNNINSFSIEAKELSNNYIKEDITKEAKKTNENANQTYNQEYFNQMKSKFEELYDKSDIKIKDLTQHLNTLIYRMNKVIFNRKDNLDVTKDSESILEKRPKKIFLENSKNKIVLPLNKSFEEKQNKTIKENESEKDNITNLKNDLKLSNKYFIHDQYLNSNLKNYNYKTTDIRGSSSDIIKSLKEKKQKTNDYYGGKFDIKSVNKIENFLIKKFTDPS